MFRSARSVWRRARRNKRTGFTLVELLVAMTLFGLLSLVVFAAMGFGTRAAASGSRGLERTEAVLLAEGLLRERIAAAAPFGFVGERQTLSFLARAPVAMGTGGLQPMTVARDAADRLVLSLGGHASVLLDQVSTVAIDYYGARSAEEEARWWDGWSTPERMPTLVRLHIVLADGHAVPDLIASPHTSLPGG